MHDETKVQNRMHLRLRLINLSKILRNIRDWWKVFISLLRFRSQQHYIPRVYEWIQTNRHFSAAT